jgi:hypothetical protein
MATIAAEYKAITGLFEGDARRFEKLMANWAKGAHGKECTSLAMA